MSRAEVKPAFSLRAQLGEGLHWEAEGQRLWGVDIHGGLLWCWDLQATEPVVWKLPQRVGWVLPVCESNHLLLGLQEGFAVAPRHAPAEIAWVNRPFPGNGQLRLNDAKADATGAVWAGSLNNDDETRPEGALFRLDTAGGVTLMDQAYLVANGPAISPCGTRMLHTDSSRRTIYEFDFDAQAGRLANRRKWKVFDASEGYPDGMCFDAQGCLWVAHWGAGCVSRFDWDGALLTRIRLPVSNVTNVCFGGPELDRLFVSTAYVGLSPTELEKQPQAGMLFEVMVSGVSGLAGLPARLRFDQAWTTSSVAN